MRHFEDFSAGDRWDFDPWIPGEAELIDFAREYDPQPLHVEPASPQAAACGGIVSSGWLTALRCVRPFVDAVMADTAALGSPGLDEVRWHRPVRSGDRIIPFAEVVDTRPAARHRDRGWVTFRIGATDEHGAPVMDMQGSFAVLRRPAA